MSSPHLIDFEAFLKPIAEDNPCGFALREHSELSRKYYAAREARNQAAEAERTRERFAQMTDEEIQVELAGRSDDPRRAPDWNKVYDLSQSLILEHSKDLWVLAWMVEALIRIEGLVGLRDSLQLCYQMVERYWGSLHPIPAEDEEPSETLAQLNAVSPTLAKLLDSSAIVDSDGRLTWGGYLIALRMESDDPQVRAAKIDAGQPSVEMYRTAMSQLGFEKVTSIREDIVETRRQCDIFNETMERCCGRDESGYPINPSISKIVETVDRLLQNFDEMAERVLSSNEATNDGSVSDPLTGEVTMKGDGSVSVLRPVTSREDALQHLLRVADYFRKTEPHSPVSYALEQAVRWGRLSLPELLKDLVGDEDVLSQMYKRMGIQKPPSEEY